HAAWLDTAACTTSRAAALRGCAAHGSATWAGIRRPLLFWLRFFRNRVVGERLITVGGLVRLIRRAWIIGGMSRSSAAARHATTGVEQLIRRFARRVRRDFLGTGVRKVRAIFSCFFHCVYPRFWCHSAELEDVRFHALQREQLANWMPVAGKRMSMS